MGNLQWGAPSPHGWSNSTLYFPTLPFKRILETQRGKGPSKWDRGTQEPTHLGLPGRRGLGRGLVRVWSELRGGQGGWWGKEFRLQPSPRTGKASVCVCVYTLCTPCAFCMCTGIHACVLQYVHTCVRVYVQEGSVSDHLTNTPSRICSDPALAKQMTRSW